MNLIVPLLLGAAIMYDSNGYVLVEPVRPTDIDIMAIEREKLQRQMDRNEESIERFEHEWRRHEEREREFEEDLKEDR